MDRGAAWGTWACALAERLERMRTLYKRVLEATEAQAHSADTEWEAHVLELTKRTLERGLAILDVRAPPAPPAPAAAKADGED